VGLFSLFVPFVKNYATSMTKTRNPAKLPYPTCFYLPQSSLMHMVYLQMSYVDSLIDASMLATPEERFLGVLKYTISTWALTKFPYKPIISLLGETAQYSTHYSRSSDPADRTYVLAENMRKDPPYSLFHITNPHHGVSYGGSIELDPKFKQAHVHVLFKGQHRTVFTHPQGLFREEYYSDIPDLIIRLLRMHTELQGEVSITSSTGFSAKITFKEKGLFSKAKNMITGKITFYGAEVFLLDGAWDEILYITDLRTGLRMEFLNRLISSKNELDSLPLEQQPASSCDRLWGTMLEALLRQDFDTAAQLKAQINRDENLILTSMEATGQGYAPKYFFKNAMGAWEIKDESLCVNMGDVFNTSAMISALPEH